MTDTTAQGVSHRTYTRPTPDAEERITVHISPDGRIRMTADSLHQLLTAIGFTETTKDT